MKRLFWVLMLTGVGLTAAAGSSWGQNVGVYGPGVHADTGVYATQAGVHSGYYHTQYHSGYYQGTGYHQGWQQQGAWNNCCPTVVHHRWHRGYRGYRGWDNDYDDDCDD